MTVSYNSEMEVVIPALQVAIALVGIWFAAMAFHTLLVRRDDIAVAALDRITTGIAGPSSHPYRSDSGFENQSSTLGGGALLAHDKSGVGGGGGGYYSATATDIRSSFASSKRPSTLADAPASPHTNRHGRAAGFGATGKQPQPGGSAAAGNAVVPIDAGQPRTQTGRSATALEGAATAAAPPTATDSLVAKGTEESRASYDALGGKRPSASVRFATTGVSDDRSLLGKSRRSAVAAIAGRPSHLGGGSLAGPRTRTATDGVSMANPLLAASFAAPGFTTSMGSDCSSFADATAMWRLMTSRDHHIRFYAGCVASGLATATIMLAIVVRTHQVAAMSPAMNTVTSFAVGSVYTTVIWLVALLNHWALDLLPRCWRALPSALIALLWSSFVVANAVGIALPDNDAAVSAIMYVSGSWAGLLALSCAATSALTVPCECRQMQLALLLLFLSLAGKTALVVPAMQSPMVDILGNRGYNTLWGAMAVIPLAAVFVTVHWHRPDRTRRRL